MSGPSCESFSFSVEMLSSVFVKIYVTVFAKKANLWAMLTWYEAKFARNCRFTQLWIIASLDVQCISYLLSNFETRTAFLHLNEDQILSLPQLLCVRSIPEMIIQEDLTFKCIHRHYASLVGLSREFQTVSVTSSVPLYNLHNHCIIT